MPPAFVLSQDQTLRLIPTTITQPRHATMHPAHTDHAQQQHAGTTQPSRSNESPSRASPDDTHPAPALSTVLVTPCTARKPQQGAIHLPKVTQQSTRQDTRNRTSRCTANCTTPSAHPFLYLLSLCQIAVPSPRRRDAAYKPRQDRLSNGFLQSLFAPEFVARAPPQHHPAPLELRGHQPFR